MESDHHETLRRIGTIATASISVPLKIKLILRTLRWSCHLRQVGLHLLDPRRKVFAHLIRAAGKELMLPAPRLLADSLEGAALRSGQIQAKGDSRAFPVLGNDGPFGVLSMQLPPDHDQPEVLQEAVSEVSTVLTHLLMVDSDSAEERLRLQAELLIELAMQLNSARDLPELLRIGLRLLLRGTGAAAVALRPVFGETLVGAASLRTAPEYYRLRGHFLQEEQRCAELTIAERAPRFYTNIPSPPPGKRCTPEAIAVLPLLFQGRLLGVLTLFGAAAEMPRFAFTEQGSQLLTAAVAQLAHALERITSRERLENLSAEGERKLLEITLLYRINRAMHSTLRLNELMHLILSAAVAPDGGGFERAMLFTINERTGMLLGMLGVTRETARLVLPPDQWGGAWRQPIINEEVQEAQRRSPFCRLVMKQRIALDGTDHPLARAVRKGKVVLVPKPLEEAGAGAALAAALQLSPYACAPLPGRQGMLGVLAVDNPESQTEITAASLHFLEMFAGQAGSAMENSLLHHRLESALLDLRETQERLIQGEKLAALGEMAASIAHELKSPLVSIGGFAQRLGRMVEPQGSAHEYAEIITREVRRMEEMLTNILAFSKKQILCFSECQLASVVEDALALEADALERAGVHLQRQLVPNLPNVQCDAHKMRQVIINLVANARHVMTDGGILTVRIYPALLRGDSGLTLEIEDTGGGIPATLLPSLFTPFFTTKERGTGLGLSISRRIIEQHHGEISVENRERGVAFIIRLPLRAS
jgi:two-component system, NtrC family, sensor histidine kinase HydH